EADHQKCSASRPAVAVFAVFAGNYQRQTAANPQESRLPRGVAAKNSEKTATAEENGNIGQCPPAIAAGINTELSNRKSECHPDITFVAIYQPINHIIIRGAAG